MTTDLVIEAHGLVKLVTLSLADWRFDQVPGLMAARTRSCAPTSVVRSRLNPQRKDLNDVAVMDWLLSRTG